MELASKRIGRTDQVDATVVPEPATVVPTGTSTELRFPDENVFTPCGGRRVGLGYLPRERVVFIRRERRQKNMKSKRLVSVLLSLGFLTAAAQHVWAQQPTPTRVTIPVKFSYSVKFVCGQPQEPSPCTTFRSGNSGRVRWICPDATVPAGANGAQAVKGLYATAINVHNPALQTSSDPGAVVFAKQVAIALPWQQAGPVSQFEAAILNSNEAFEVDCEEIAATYLNSVPVDTSTPPPFPEFLKGFLVIMSPTELDVTAVYTARPLSGGVSAMDVQVIYSRKQEGVIQANVPPGPPSDGPYR